VDDPATPQNENEFTWTVANHNAHANRVSDGFWWWKDLAAINGVYLTYVLRFFPGSYWQQQVPFEPIRRNTWPNDYDWISRVIGNHGVTTGTTSRARARAWGNHVRAQLAAKNAFCVFSPYNPPGAPEQHPDGRIAYGWYGDYVHLLYDNGGYPIEQTSWVFAHEMGHVFYACDEYAQQCSSNCTNCYGTGEGPRPASMNWNCERCTPGGPAACIMHSLTSSIWTNHSACIHTRRMVGWPL
jgi:hypothetical protein